jgi:hypothetical protein
MSKKWVVRDVHGDVLYEGVGKTRRGFLESLVADRKSLALADLSGWDLSALNLAGADLRGARLDGADLRGTVLKRARLDGVSARCITRNGVEWPTRFQGSLMEGTCFDRADLEGADFGACRATHATFIGAKFDRTSFARATLTGVVFSYARGRGTDFSETFMTNVDFAHAKLFKPDFRGADVRHNAFGGVDDPVLRKRLESHLPNRTRGAVIVAGTYDRETQLTFTVPALQTDRLVSKGLRGLFWSTSAMGAVAGGLQFEEWADKIGPVLGVTLPHAGLGLIGIVGVAHFMKDIGGEWLRDKTDAGLDALSTFVRTASHEFDRRVVRRARFVVAMALTGSLEPLKAALSASRPEARKRGIWSAFSSFLNEVGEVVLCDRRHLALSLATLSRHARHDIALTRDIVVVRRDGAHADGEGKGPCAMRFGRDGTSTAVWSTGARDHVSVRYGVDGDAAEAWDSLGERVDISEITSLGLPPEAGRKASSAFALEAAMLQDNGLSGFDYPRSTHFLEDGRDGTLFVRRIADRKYENTRPDQPAILTSDGSGWMARMGGIGIVHRNLTIADQSGAHGRHRRRVAPRRIGIIPGTGIDLTPPAPALSARPGTRTRGPRRRSGSLVPATPQQWREGCPRSSPGAPWPGRSPRR